MSFFHWITQLFSLFFHPATEESYRSPETTNCSQDSSCPQMVSGHLLSPQLLHPLSSGGGSQGTQYWRRRGSSDEEITRAPCVSGEDCNNNL